MMMMVVAMVVVVVVIMTESLDSYVPHPEWNENAFDVTGSIQTGGNPDEKPPRRRRVSAP